MKKIYSKWINYIVIYQEHTYTPKSLSLTTLQLLLCKDDFLGPFEWEFDNRDLIATKPVSS